MARIYLIILLISGILPLSVSGKMLDSANAVFNAGRTEEALKLYKKAAARGENRVLSSFNIANCYYQLDSLPQSIEYYRAVTLNAPDFYRAWLNLGVCYVALDAFGEAVAALQRAVALEPEREQGLFMLGATYRQMGALTDAVLQFEKLIEQSPQNGKAYIALAELYAELEDYEKAIELLAEYPEGANSADDSHIALLQADFARNLNNVDRELYYLRRAFESNRENRWILYRIVETLVSTGSDLVALEEARRGLDLFPDFSELAVYAGNIAFRMERLTDAERFYTLGRNSGSSNAVIGLENIRIMRRQQAARED
ncbi:MAG: tetratricopeptide repeat protein [Fibrobacterota bacterium]